MRIWKMFRISKQQTHICCISRKCAQVTVEYMHVNSFTFAVEYTTHSILHSFVFGYKPYIDHAKEREERFHVLVTMWPPSNRHQLIIH